jgi:hypothetical protein
MTGGGPAQTRGARRCRRRRLARLTRLAFLLSLVAIVSFGVVRLLRRPPHRPRLPAPRGRLAAATPAEPLAQLAQRAGFRCDPIGNGRLVVDKSDLELRFYAGERLLKTYPVALGPGGLGDKQRRDDGCTPEGEFRIVERVMRANPRRWGDVWMLLNYPLPEDAERGLAAGLIGRQQRDAIVEAAQRREVPPQDTRLGSGIGIHIGGIKPRNWTQGCIALEREDGIEVCEQVRVGTPVTIRQ